MAQPPNDWETKYFASLEAVQKSRQGRSGFGDFVLDALGEVLVEGACSLVTSVARVVIEILVEAVFSF